MGELVIVAFLGGLITGLLAVHRPRRPRRRRGGLLVGDEPPGAPTSSSPVWWSASASPSFSRETVLSFLHLPLDFLFWLGVEMLGAISLGRQIPRLGELLERPFARLGSESLREGRWRVRPRPSLGPVFVPCVGPVLTAISVAAAHRHVGFQHPRCSPRSFIPQLASPCHSSSWPSRPNGPRRWKSLRRRSAAVRQVAGVVLGLATLAIAFNWLGAL